MGGGSPACADSVGTVPISSLVFHEESLWRRMRSCLQSEPNSLEREANDPRAYECHYLSPISNPDSRARLSLSCRTGQLSSQRAEPSSFPLLGFQMVTRAPTAMATGTVENLTLKCGLELAAFVAGAVIPRRLFLHFDFAHPSRDRRDPNQGLWGHVVHSLLGVKNGSDTHRLHDTQQVT